MRESKCGKYNPGVNVIGASYICSGVKTNVISTMKIYILF